MGALKVQLQDLLYNVDYPEGSGSNRSNAILWLAACPSTLQLEKHYLLQLSVIQGKTKAVEALLQQGVDPNGRMKLDQRLDGSPGSYAFQQRIDSDDTFLSLAERTRRYHERKTDKIIASLLNHTPVINVNSTLEHVRRLAGLSENAGVESLSVAP